MPCAVFAVTKVTFLGQLSSFLPVICHVTFDPNTSEDALQYVGVSFPPASRNMNHPLNALSHFGLLRAFALKPVSISRSFSISSVSSSLNASAVQNFLEVLSAKAIAS